MKFKIALIISITLIAVYCKGQSLQPGFNGKEFLDILSIGSRVGDSLIRGDATPAPAGYTIKYRSQVAGFANRFDFWLRNDEKLGIISIRGTINNSASWLANIYAAMQPAHGSLKISDSLTFNYRLAELPNAAVHTGWLIALGIMAGDIERSIMEQYAKGIRDFIIAGHSQGAAIAYLLRSHLYYRTKAGALPKDIIYKTYCSAAPKPGNLYYAYDYDFINSGGWALTVVNAADWVPEIPFSIQQVTDLNALSPFSHIKKVLKKQKLLVRLYAGAVYNKMSRSTSKAQKRYEKYLGYKINSQARKLLPQLSITSYAPSMNYMRTGTPVVLVPDDAYFEKFPNDAQKKNGIWNHHFFEAYYVLTKKWYINNSN
ncbi:MAG: lipase family protein [Chitinophagaceae bacterium]|nr:lipase family protein [Chitinophagaceae bacterium]